MQLPVAKVTIVVNHAMVVDFFVPPPALPLSASADNLPGLLSGRSLWDIGHCRSWAQRVFFPLLRLALTLHTDRELHRPLNEKRSKFHLSHKTQSEIHQDRLILVEQVLGVEYPRPVPPLMHFVGYLERRDEPELQLKPAEVDWLSGVASPLPLV